VKPMPMEEQQVKEAFHVENADLHVERGKRIGEYLPSTKEEDEEDGDGVQTIVCAPEEGEPFEEAP